MARPTELTAHRRRPRASASRAHRRRLDRQGGGGPRCARIPDTTDVLALYEVNMDSRATAQGTDGCAATPWSARGGLSESRATGSRPYPAAPTARPSGPTAAASRQPRRHPRAGARQGIVIAGDIQGESPRHRAAHDQDPPADRVGRQGQGDGHRLVAQRPDARPRGSGAGRGEPRLQDRIEELEAGSGDSSEEGWRG